MKNIFLTVSVFSLTVLSVAGCGSGQPEMTKAQEDAARHPTKDPNWKGPDPAGQKQMGEAIAAWTEKHKNDKVEFKTGG